MAGREQDEAVFLNCIRLVENVLAEIQQIFYAFVEQLVFSGADMNRHQHGTKPERENGTSMVDVLVCKSKEVDKAAKNETVRFESFSDLIQYLSVEPADDNVFSLSAEIWRDIKAGYKSSSSFIGNMTEEDSVNGVVDGVESLLGDVTSLFRYEEKTDKNMNNSRKIKDSDKKKKKDRKKKNDFFPHGLNFFGQKKRKDKDMKKNGRWKER